MRTRVKICGISRPEDGLAAADAGADAIGLVFYVDSPRAVDFAAAERVLAVLPAFVSAVALFVNADPEHIRAVLAALPIDLLQFHGDEAPDECRGYGRPYLKAVRMRPGIDVQAEASRYSDARALLLDAYRPGVHGGTGKTFDWARVPSSLDTPVVLAGGLDPYNVGAAIAAARPFGVDVSGGVEAAKGRKDHRLIGEFVRAVQQADQAR